MEIQNKDQHNSNMGTKNKTKFFIKVILIYLAGLCLIVSINFLIHIEEILSTFNFTAVMGVVFLAIYLFILSMNAVFIIRNKTEKDYKLILLYNFIFSLFSGFSIRLPDFLITNNLGTDFSIVFFKLDTGSKFFLHYDIFNFVVKFQHLDTGQHVFGLQINLFIWAIGLFLFFCYKSQNIIKAGSIA
jgi:hypothetical protein